MLDGFASSTPRRGFLGSIAAAAMGVGITGLLPEQAAAAPLAGATSPELEAWFAKLKAGKHRVVFDAPESNEGFPVVFPRVYQLTTDATYPNEGTASMVIIRHAAIAMALQDHVWAKYHLGEQFGVKTNNAPATANPWATITGLPLPDLGVTGMLKTGVLIGACDVALTVNAGRAAARMKMDPAAVKKEWVAGLFPGIMVVPSGVMAVARAQEFDASYIFAG